MSKEKDRAKKIHIDVDNRMDLNEYNELYGGKKKSAPKAARFKSAPPEKDTARKPNTAVIAAGTVLIVCVAILAVTAIHYFEAIKIQDTVENIVNNSIEYNVIHPETEAPAETLPAASDDPEETSPETETVREPLVLTNMAVQFLEINPDVVGYVRIPGAISEPVVQYSDNDYYLTHNLYGNVRQCGTCFADYKSNVNDYPDLMSDNIILYSHNQKDGTMFGNMDYYRYDLSYWAENPFIYFSNNYEEGTYVIISSFVTNSIPESDDGNLFDYWNYIDFGDDYTYENFIKEITERSQIITGVDVKEGDKFVTLSTCSTEWDDARHVIVARRLRKDETEESIDRTKLQTNPNPKWPAIYYKYHGGSYEAG